MHTLTLLLAASSPEAAAAGHGAAQSGGFADTILHVWLPQAHNGLIVALLLAGAFISLSGSLGLLRFPDFYARLHTAGKTDSLAQLCIFAGLALVIAVPGPDGALRDVDMLIRIKLLMVALILFFTAPTATHAITKAAQLDGLKPWTKADAERAQEEDGHE